MFVALPHRWQYVVLHLPLLLWYPASHRAQSLDHDLSYLYQPWFLTDGSKLTMYAYDILLYKPISSHGGLQTDVDAIH